MAKMKLQSEQLAADRKRLNMSKAEYALFRRTYLELRRKSDQVVDAREPLKRLKNLYLRQWDDDEEEFEDCNIVEIDTIRKRR